MPKEVYYKKKKLTGLSAKVKNWFNSNVYQQDNGQIGVYPYYWILYSIEKDQTTSIQKHKTLSERNEIQHEANYMILFMDNSINKRQN